MFPRTPNFGAPNEYVRLAVCTYSWYRYAKYDPQTNLTLTISDQAQNYP